MHGHTRTNQSLSSGCVCRYGRFNWGARNYGIWDIWRADVREVIYQRLVNIPAKIIWKSYSPTHFGGATGTFTNVRLLAPCVSFGRIKRSPSTHPHMRRGAAHGCCRMPSSGSGHCA